MKACEILEKFEFFPVKEKQKFLLMFYHHFHNGITGEDFVQRFVRLICNNEGSSNTGLFQKDIIQRIEGAEK